MIHFAPIFDGGNNDILFLLVILTITLAALNVMITGRARVGFAATLYRVAFIVLAIAAANIFIAFYDAGITSRAHGLMFMGATDFLLVARLYAVRVDRSFGIDRQETGEVVSSARRSGLCRAERIADWLTH